MTPNKTARPAYAPKGIHTLIGAGMRIEGDIACPGVLRVQGTINGNVACDSSAEGAVVLDSGGSIVGTVKARYVVVSGSVAGPVQSSRYCEVNPGASIAGDIGFKALAIHSGGIVEGRLSRVSDGNPAEAGGEPPVRETVAVESEGRSRATRIFAILAVVAIVVAGGWWGRDALVVAPDSMRDKTSPAHEAPPPAVVAAPRNSGNETAAAIPVPPAPVVPAPATADEDIKSQDGVVSVRGTNPNRPANVFLLVSHESSMLYRKKRQDTGEGTRVAVSQGEKVSVSIGKDELVRVAKGTHIEIFYQGRRVPMDVIEAGSWIEFVPR